MMTRKREAVSALLLFLAVNAINARPLQHLPDMPGFIPVYIRYGDQPLEEINPLLAEAFRETSGILKSIPEIPLNELTRNNPNKDLTDRNDVSLDIKEDTSRENFNPSIPPKQLTSNLPEEKHTFPLKPSDKDSVVMKLSKPTLLDKIDLKKIKEEIEEKEENK